MQTIQANRAKLTGQFSIAMAIFVAFVGVALLLRTELSVHAVEGAKPVGADIGELAISSGFAEMIDAVTPAVVSLAVTKQTPAGYMQQGQDFFEQFKRFGPNQPPQWFWDFFRQVPDQGGPKKRAPRRFAGVGAGVVFDPSGLIVTNHHVISDAADIQVTLYDGQTLAAEVVGVDKWTDLAVLRVDADEQIPYAEFGDTSQVRVGDWAIAIGDPFGLSQSVSLGIVSGMDRNFAEDSPKVPLLQVDAAVNRGNSGGPLFNSNGQVIGINTMIISPSGASAGVGFAVPAAVVEQIVATIQSEGRVNRGWLGVGIQNVTPQIASALNLDENTVNGALVSNVEADSPAEEAGIEEGDIIVAFDGEPVDDIVSLSNSVKQTAPGSDISISVLRGGERVELQGTLDLLAYGESGDEPAAVVAEAEEQRSIGATVAKLTPDMRKKYRIRKSVKGVVITDVQADSPAEKVGLKEGDIIVSINNNAVRSSTEVGEAIRSVAESGNAKALLLVADGNGEQLFIVVELS